MLGGEAEHDKRIAYGTTHTYAATVHHETHYKEEEMTEPQ